MGTMTNRKASIEGAAEQIAMELIRNGLMTDNPNYVNLCERLARFKPLLAQHKASHAASDKAETMRLLNALVDKLGGMAKMMGILRG